MNELKKEFLPHQEALALKDLGFDEPCLMYWNDYGRTSINRFQLLNNIDEWCQDYIEAPLYQQAFRWFREKHGLVHGIIIGDIVKFEKGIPSYSGAVWYSKNVNFTHLKNVDYSTYEEAELACLKKLIEIVKSRK